MLSVDIALPDVEELHKLVKDGQEKGFLTYDEIVNALEDVDLTKEQVEDFTTYLIDHSVELVEGEQHKSLPQLEPPAPARRPAGAVAAPDRLRSQHAVRHHLRSGMIPGRRR